MRLCCAPRNARRTLMPNEEMSGGAKRSPLDLLVHPQPRTLASFCDCFQRLHGVRPGTISIREKIHKSQNMRMVTSIIHVRFNSSRP